MLIDSQILFILAGGSTFLGFLGILAYLYLIQQIRIAGQSVREIIDGERLIDSKQVIEIIGKFQDDASRLKALEQITNHDKYKAKELLKSINNDNIQKLQLNSIIRNKKIIGWTTLLFFALAFIALAQKFIPMSDSLLGLSTNGFSPIEEVTKFAVDKDSELRKRIRNIRYASTNYMQSGPAHECFSVRTRIDLIGSPSNSLENMVSRIVEKSSDLQLKYLKENIRQAWIGTSITLDGLVSEGTILGCIGR
jgi:hypothetical protein